jgi:hypothetical protein
MKHVVIYAIITVLLSGCGSQSSPSQSATNGDQEAPASSQEVEARKLYMKAAQLQSAPAPEAKPVEPVAEAEKPIPKPSHTVSIDVLYDYPKEVRSSDDVYQSTTVKRDNFEKSITVKVPSLEFVNSGHVYEWFLMRARITHGVLRYIQIYFSTMDPHGVKWLHDYPYFNRVVDIEGDTLSLVEIDRSRSQFGSREHVEEFAINFDGKDRGYLDVRRNAGVSFRVYSSKWSDVTLNYEIPGFYIDGFLKKLDEELKSEDK